MFVKTAGMLPWLWAVGLASLSPAFEFNPGKYDGQAQTITRIRIASAAVLPDKWNKAANWGRIERAVERAAVDGGADLVVTPEGVLEGYVVNEVNREEDPEKKAELKRKFLEAGEPIDGPYIQKACALSDRLDLYLVLGFLERRGENLYNTAALIDPDGDIIGRYSKTHFAQGYAVNPEFYTAGEDYPVFQTPFGIVGIIICYDRQPPEPARIMAVKGAQLLLVPSYGSYDNWGGWNTALMRTRAYENHVPLVFCNPFQSLLITAGGEIKAMGNTGEIVYFDVSTDPERYRNRFRNRRPPAYRPLMEGTDPVEDKQ